MYMGHYGSPFCQAGARCSWKTWSCSSGWPGAVSANGAAPWSKTVNGFEKGQRGEDMVKVWLIVVNLCPSVLERKLTKNVSEGNLNQGKMKPSPSTFTMLNCG